MAPQGQAPTGHNRYDVIVPLFPLIRHADVFGDSRSFGYDYDNMDEMSWVETVKTTGNC